MLTRFGSAKALHLTPRRQAFFAPRRYRVKFDSSRCASESSGCAGRSGAFRALGDHYSSNE
jgi:hypothetical protein